MSSLIEQAAARLEQLRQAGVDIPAVPKRAPAQDLPELPTMPAPVAAPAVEEPNPQSKRVDLDLVALGAQGFLVPTVSRTIIADQYRVIKRPLIKNAMGKGADTLNHGNLIMVTSALAGEGKSFTSLNLAMSI